MEKNQNIQYEDFEANKELTDCAEIIEIYLLENSAFKEWCKQFHEIKSKPLPLQALSQNEEKTKSSPTKEEK
jgi:hypothetical protein